MTVPADRPPALRRTLLVGAAWLAELAAAWLLLQGWVIVALVLHLGASLLCASSIERSAQTYRDALFVGALAVPVLGPLLAWALLQRPRSAAVNAHAFFENYEAEVHGAIELERTDLENRSRAMSFHEVLRHGSMDHRRNALRKLAQRGQRMHMELLRRCLSHRDMELRLGAFTELNRLLRGWEDRLSELGDAVTQQPRDARRRAALSRAHREYAASGLLDADMARFQLLKAARACELTVVPMSSLPDLAVERAMVFAELGDMGRAIVALRRVDGPSRDEPQVCIARARIAFLTRRFADVRQEVERLRATAAEVPRWMNEFCPASAELAEVAR